MELKFVPRGMTAVVVIFVVVIVVFITSSDAQMTSSQRRQTNRSNATIEVPRTFAACRSLLTAASALTNFTSQLPVRSVCKWTYGVDHSSNRNPSDLPVAVCALTPQPAPIDGTQVQCEPVHFYVAVRHRRPNTGDSSDQWQDGWERVAVGCSVVRVRSSTNSPADRTGTRTRRPSTSSPGRRSGTRTSRPGRSG